MKFKDFLECFKIDLIITRPMIDGIRTLAILRDRKNPWRVYIACSPTEGIEGVFTEPMFHPYFSKRVRGLNKRELVR